MAPAVVDCGRTVKYTPSQVTNRMRYGLRRLFDPEPTPGEKARALEFFGNACAYCGETGSKLHLDHLVASSERYGHNHISNRVPACSRCNAKEKRERPWRDFVAEKCRDEPATIPALERIEAWVKEWEGSAKPPENLLDILEEEFARVKAEYEMSVKRLREAKGEKGTA